LLTGGSGSGKSTFGEALAARLPEPRTYIATMRPFEGESEEKILRHQFQRADKGFSTIERETGLSDLRLPARGTALLECVCNLAANEMFDSLDNIRPGAEEAILSGIEALSGQCETLIVVTNDVGSDGGGYDESTMRYVDLIGRVNRELASRFDCVCELVCGIPLVIKGFLP
jgi:adenosylcobinamide kinase/adenosylcobinamide-phosphate guanylyltransferase